MRVADVYIGQARNSGELFKEKGDKENKYRHEDIDYAPSNGGFAFLVNSRVTSTYENIFSVDANQAINYC